MRPFVVILFLVASAFCPVHSAAQTAAAFPPLEPDPLASEYARRNGGAYTWEDLAEISLWASGSGTESAASGVRGAVQPSFMDMIRGGAAELKTGLPADPKEQGEYILSYMHKKYLKSYSLLQTRMDTLLSSGRYNCVSSAVLYLILAGSAGLEAGGVMTKDHAFASVHINGEFIDAETTNPYGFDPGNRKDFHDDFGKLTGFAYVPAKNYRDRSAISPIELVSLILSNRIAELENRGRFAEAVPLAINRAELLKDRKNPTANAFFEDPRRDMMNRIFNFGASLLKAGKEDEALRWAAYASPRYPDNERWQEFVNAAVNNRLVKLIQQKRAAGARDFLTVNAAPLSSSNYAKFDAMLTDAELAERSRAFKNTGEEGPILAAINEAEKKALIPAERAAELRTFVIGKASTIIAETKDWRGAIRYLENALAAQGPNRQLEQALANYKSNLAADYHNRFAGAYNRKNYEEAERILNEGLLLFPDNRQLIADKRTLENRSGR